MRDSESIARGYGVFLFYTCTNLSPGRQCDVLCIDNIIN